KVNPTAWIYDAPSAAAAGVPYPYAGFSAYAGMAIQPFPQVAGQTWGPIYSVGTNTGVSRYDSLQVQLTKRMSHGLVGQFSYIYSKARGDVDTAFDETWDNTAGVQDMRNLGAEANIPLSYDQTHIEGVSAISASGGPWAAVPQVGAGLGECHPGRLGDQL